ncbi:MAG: pantoate--beta-alanine ligase [Actinomycetota bacterium]|nr:pantoate--beta-alanine ligase [Actinomycetota bacterium]
MTSLVHFHREIPALCRGEVAVVMTMGALHDGHAELMRVARGRVGAGGTVIVTIFVNPTQFGAGEDLDKYPRTLESDWQICQENAVDIVYAPNAVDVYGTSNMAELPESEMVDAGPVGLILEGTARPGHFRGMLTVVRKLQQLTGAHFAMFGEKDYQQLVLVTQMFAERGTSVQVVPVPTVREPDGLALSSRNRYLTVPERFQAALIPQAVAAAVATAQYGEDAAVAAGLEVLSKEPAIKVDYFVVTAPDLGPAPARGPARVVVAVRLGATRLLDNAPCDLGAAA